MNDQELKKWGHEFRTGSLGKRIMFYILVCFIVAGFIFVGMLLGGTPDDFRWMIMAGMGYVFFIVLRGEFRTRSWRKKMGFPANSNVRKLFEERELQIEAEKIRKVNDMVGETKGLDYYYELLQKGAITDEEYEVKKRELL